MARYSFIRAINALASEAARRERLASAESRRHIREAERAARQAVREAKLATKEAKQHYLEQRVSEADDCNVDLAARLEELQSVLEHSLSVGMTTSFDILRIRGEFSPFAPPRELTIASPPPDKQQFLSKVKPLGFFENALGLNDRYMRDQEAAILQYEAAKKTYDKSEAERRAKLEKLLAEYEVAKQAFMLKAQQRNQEVDELEAGYRSGELSAVITYNSMVLERSEYPDGFPQTFRLVYIPESKELVIEYQLSSVDIVPAVAEYSYVKTKDIIDEKPRKAKEIKELYEDIVAAIALRVIHEVLEADRASHIQVIVFSGFVETVNPATGKDIRPCLISLRVTRERFSELNLKRIDKRACLRNLGAQVSPKPEEMLAVKPVIEFDMADKRFVEQGDILSDLDTRPNLMDLNPFEFENLVSNLFSKMGLESKLTRSSRDGGIDAVAFDTRPIIGGKVVIQAKRYKNPVGVAAVRDLYGTMINEGANKGILVTTSSYGPDAYDFAKDKPIELVDGGGLLYLLEQVGVKARIVFPAD